MEKLEAQQMMADLIGPLADCVPDSVLEAATAAAITYDPQGRTPDQPGYVESYDPHWLAAEAVTALAVKQLGEDTITRFTSEGATFETRRADLFAMADRLRAQSALARAAGAGLGMLEVDGQLAGYTPTSHGRPAGRFDVAPNGMLVPPGMDWT